MKFFVFYVFAVIMMSLAAIGRYAKSRDQLKSSPRFRTRISAALAFAVHLIFASLFFYLVLFDPERMKKALPSAFVGEIALFVLFLLLFSYSAILARLLGLIEHRSAQPGGDRRP